MLTADMEFQPSPAFIDQYEEYKRICNERYKNQRSQEHILKDAQEESKDEDLSLSSTTCTSTVSSSPFYDRPTTPTTTTTITSTTASTTLIDEEEEEEEEDNSQLIQDNTARPNGNNTKKAIGLFNSWGRKSSSKQVEKKNTNKPNAFTSFCSNIFINKNKKEATSLKDNKKESEYDDAKVAQLVSTLKDEGRNDREIASSLSYLYAKEDEERSNTLGQWVRDIIDTFREELSWKSSPAPRLSVQVYASPYDAYDDDLSYESLLNLESIPKGVKDLSQLPVHTFDGKPLPSEQTSCPICIAPFDAGEELRSLKCFHFFHRECIDEWLRVANSCPYCKSQVE